jgi:purine nucleosidase
LYGVCSDRNYFSLSEPGNVTVEADGFTRFVAAAGGRDRFLILTQLQAARVREALVQLASEPPDRK